jgi:hypothetical protein
VTEEEGSSCLRLAHNKDKTQPPTHTTTSSSLGLSYHMDGRMFEKKAKRKKKKNWRTELRHDDEKMRRNAVN